MTCYSSFAIGIVSVWLNHFQSHISYLAPLFTLMMGTSILYHAMGGRYIPNSEVEAVYYCDKTLVHILGLTIFYSGLVRTTVLLKCNLIDFAQESCQQITWYQDLWLLVYWLAYSYVIWVYFIAKKSALAGDDWKPWHASIHIVASIGIIALTLT